MSRASLDKVKKSLLPLAFFPVSYPVVDYDHHTGMAIAGGFVYRGREIPELQGCYVFGDIVNGRLFYFDTKEVGPGDRAELFELSLFTDGRSTSLAKLVGGERVDLRLAQGDRGELLLLNKHDNVIRGLSALK